MKEQMKKFKRLLLLLWLGLPILAIIAAGSYLLWRQYWSVLLGLLALCVGGISVITTLIAFIGFRFKNTSQNMSVLIRVSLLGIVMNLFLGFIFMLLGDYLITQSQIQIINRSEISIVTAVVRPGEWGEWGNATRSKRIAQGDSKTFWVEGSCEVQKTYSVEINAGNFDTTLFVHCRGGTVALFGKKPDVKIINLIEKYK